MKWAVLGYPIFEKRYLLLNEFVQQFSPGSKVDMISLSHLDFDQEFPKLLSAYPHLRIDSPYCARALTHFKKKSMQVASLQAIDCVMSDGKDWWPHSFLFSALSQIFARHGSSLDLTSEVLIVGAGAAARIGIAAAAKAGFNKISISSKFDDEGIDLLRSLKRQYLGCQFTYIPQDRLVLLPGTCCLVINTTPMLPSNDLLPELNYLNFLKRDGMVWDLVIEPATTPLIKEAEQIDIGCVRGYEVAAITDAMWLGQVFGKEANLSEICSQYRKTFDSLVSG